MRKDLSITTLSGTYLTYKNDMNELVVVAKQPTTKYLVIWHDQIDGELNKGAKLFNTREEAEYFWNEKLTSFTQVLVIIVIIMKLRMTARTL
jgi:hypothetical protein